jgi:NADP-reducing hydrogenase subunit HndC
MMKEQRIILKNAGIIQPDNIDDAIVHGGYEALKSTLAESPSHLLEIIEKCGLKGRGGAGFPTGIKAQTTSQSEAICLKYIVCNADEGEPGTFKDRFIMENDPHLLIEGIIMAAYAVGASKGYIYIRGEYYKSIDLIEKSIFQAKEKGFLGQNIAGSDFSLDIELVIGAGSYLCGEELTLLESLEGKRGYPRIKPPFPAEKGLWQQPTLVNNVETLANLPVVIRTGVEEYIALGTLLSPGTKLVCLSGDIQKPGTYEVAMGSLVRDIIFDLGQGTKSGTLAAVLLGGAAGTFASPEQLSVPLGFAELKKENLTLGSGAIIVFSAKTSFKKVLTSIFDFFKHESCGKCVPCRAGTAQISYIWKEACNGTQEDRKNALLEIEQISQQIALSSLCPLGQSPILPVSSFIKNCFDQLD